MPENQSAFAVSHCKLSLLFIRREVISDLGIVRNRVGDAAQAGFRLRYSLICIRRNLVYRPVRAVTDTGSAAVTEVGDYVKMTLIGTELNGVMGTVPGAASAVPATVPVYLIDDCADCN
jgi:hypothetical protein